LAPDLVSGSACVSRPRAPTKSNARDNPYLGNKWLIYKLHVDGPSGASVEIKRRTAGLIPEHPRPTRLREGMEARMIEIIFSHRLLGPVTVEIIMIEGMTGGSALDMAAAVYGEAARSWYPGDPDVTITIRGLD
jgi:hypothetical protein